jgi:hypothetical protein
MDRKDAVVLKLVTRERSCDGKLKLRTPEYAESLAKKLSKQHGHTLKHYFCVFCEGYHLYTESERR